MQVYLEVFWVVTPCICCGTMPRFQTSMLHSTLKIEAVGTSEMFVPYNITWRHNPEDLDLKYFPLFATAYSTYHSNSRENYK